MGKANTVLIVEDSNVFARVLNRRIQEQLRLNTLVAKTKAEAIELVHSHRDDIFLALLDLTLPDAQGLEIVDAIGDFSLPFIVFSASYDEKMRDILFSKGVIDFVIKENPASSDFVVSFVGRLSKNRQISVIIADDSKTSRQQLAALMRRFMLRVHEAESGEQALQLLKTEADVKLILADYHMPSMNGAQLIDAVRASYPKDSLAIIGLSASGGAVSSRLLKAGANDFINKPFSPEELYCRVAQNLDLQDQIKTLRDAATRDYLTNLPNRRFFFECARPIFSSARRGHVAIAVAMLDIDHFKRINDCYGHEVGDTVLKAIAGSLTENSRETDVIGRFGGEEFAFIAVDARRQGAHILFDRLRRAIESLSITANSKRVEVTASIGVADELAHSLDDMLACADEALYQAKRSGRNRVVFSQPAEPKPLPR